MEVASSGEGLLKLGLVAILAIGVLGISSKIELPPLPPFPVSENDEFNLETFPIITQEMQVYAFPLADLDIFVESFPLDERNLQDMIFIFPVTEQGIVVLEVSRAGWEFTDEVKDLAWDYAVRTGQIPPDADPKDYQFHHKIPVAYARKYRLSQSLISSVANVQIIHKLDHVDLHREYTIEELGQIYITDLPTQLELFGDSK